MFEDLLLLEMGLLCYLIAVLGLLVGKMYTNIPWTPESLQYYVRILNDFMSKLKGGTLKETLKKFDSGKTS